MRNYPGALLSLFLAATVGGYAGCASDDDTGSGDRGDAVGGKADENDGGDVDCAETALDDGGVCRRANGQFAPAVCCAEAAACANATIDDGGACRDTINGQFVPAECCDSLCAGTAIINGFCRDEATGRFALAACCADQCFDLEATSFDPESAPAGSCEGACGGQGSGACFCDDICLAEGDCCADAAELCADDIGFSDGTDSASSCEGSCGGPAPSESCFCDDVCADFGDCCGDKVAQCGGPGEDAIVACEVDECEGAAVDDNFICRKPNGQFANQQCCSLDRCGNADLEFDETSGQAICRDTENGQFIPMVCCDARCDGAELDRSGICRMTDSGEFADPACCADQCFQAEQRGNVGNIDACNGTQAPPE